jgi:hypothetical protein
MFNQQCYFLPYIGDKSSLPCGTMFSLIFNGLWAGGELTLTMDKEYKEIGTVQCAYVDYANTVRAAKAGDRVCVDDGLMSLIVEETSAYLI